MIKIVFLVVGVPPKKVVNTSFATEKYLLSLHLN